ncbi:hypothetical protein NDU88_008343 [Pleurodeles waltl]|uniref:Uncharacterized protein n=1 Tax=Pleurodeles waltl TaxID=8319 RepID=A0AAV7PRV9_PLEWA|nr:hypothetical protein NDU88_008343 [Pleurodeles waltl]
MDAAAPFHADPGTARQPTATTEDKTPENGNPDIRIPIALSVEERTPHCREEKEVADKAGNPDIRVPKSVKSEEGLCARRTEEEKNAEEKDTEEEMTETANREDIKGSERTRDPHLGGTEAENNRETPTEGQDSPQRLELRHVPGGTWLKQGGKMGGCYQHLRRHVCAGGRL